MAVAPKEPIESLHAGLIEQGLYTKDLDQFKKQYSDDAAIDRLYKGLKEQGLYSKTKDDFVIKYFGKKKEPTTQDLVGAAKQRKEIGGKIKEIRRAAQFGGVQPDVSGLEEDATKAGETLKGYEDIEQDLATLPTGEGIAYDVKPLAALKKNNPQQYDRTVATIRAQGGIFNAAKEKEGAEVAHALQKVYEEGQYVNDYKSQRAATKQAMDMARMYDPEVRKDIATDKAYGYGLDLPGTKEAIDADERYIGNGGNLNNYQVLAMQYLEDVDPAKAIAYDRYINTKGVGTGMSDSKVGFDVKARELERIGKNLQRFTLEEKLTNNPNDAESLGRLNTLMEDYRTESSRYPAAANMDAYDLMQEATKDSAGPLKRFILGVGEDVGDPINWIGDVVTSPFKSDNEKGLSDLELIGDKRVKQSLRYTPEDERLVGSDIVAKFSPQLQGEIDAIKNSGVTDDEKRGSITRLIAENQDKVTYAPNDKAGRANFTTKAILNATSDAASSLISQASLAYLTGGFGNVSKARQLTTLYATTFATTYDDYYNEALVNDVPNPSTYALTKTAIEASTELINNDLSAVKKLFGGKGVVGNIIEGVTEAEWKNARKNGLFKKLVDAAKPGINNAIQETKEEVAGQIASNIADRYAFDREVGTFDNVGTTALHTMVGMIPLGGLSLPFNYKNISRNRQYALYEMGSNPDRFLKQVEADVESGAITPREADVRKDQIERAQQAVDGTFTTRTDGSPLTDNEKVEAAFNNVVLADIKEQSKNAPPQIKEKLEEAKAELELKQAKILTPHGEKGDLDADKTTNVAKSTPKEEVLAEDNAPILVNDRKKSDNVQSNEQATIEPVKNIKQFTESEQAGIMNSEPVKESDSAQKWAPPKSNVEPQSHEVSGGKKGGFYIDAMDSVAKKLGDVWMTDFSLSRKKERVEMVSELSDDDRQLINNMYLHPSERIYKPTVAKKETVEFKERLSTLKQGITEQQEYAEKYPWTTYREKYPDSTLEEYRENRVARIRRNPESLKYKREPLKKGDIHDNGLVGGVLTVDQNNAVEAYYETATVEDAIQGAKEYFKNAPSNEIIQRGIEFIEPLLKLTDKINIGNGMSKDIHGLYDIGSNTVYVNPMSHSTEAEYHQTMLHELAHAVTIGAVDKDPIFSSRLNEVIGHLRSKFNLPDSDRAIYEGVKSGDISRDFYGLMDNKELISEIFTNKKFYDRLKEIRYEGSTLLTHFIYKLLDAFERLTGINLTSRTKRNSADAILKIIEDKFKNTKKITLSGKGKAESVKDKEIRQLLRDTSIPERQIIDTYMDVMGVDEATAIAAIKEARQEVINTYPKKAKERMDAGDTEANTKQWLMDTLYVSESIAQNIIENAKNLQDTKSVDRGAPDAGVVVTEEQVQQFMDKMEMGWRAKTLQMVGAWFKKNFTSDRGLGQKWLAISEQAAGSKKIASRNARRAILQLQDAVKSTGFNEYDKITQAMITGHTANLPQEVGIAVTNMRAILDGFSQSLVDNGYVSPSQAVIIENNIGEYLNRSYRLYTEKGWAKKVPKEHVRAAQTFLTQQHLNNILQNDPNTQNAEQQAMQLAANEVQDILTLKKDPAGVKYETINRDISPLKQREDIPEPIRKLMGEYTDPATAFIVSVSKLAALHAQSEMLIKLKNEFKGTIFFEKNDPDRPEGFNHEIAGSGSETWTPLNGLYTSEYFMDELRRQQDTLMPFMAWWKKALAYVKKGKTVWSIPTQTVNFVANIGIALANGHVTPSKLKNLNESWKYYKDSMFKNETEQNEFLEIALKHNVIGQSVDLGMIRSFLGKDKPDEFDLERSLEKPPNKWNPINWIKGLDKIAEKQYQASDSFWKIYGFANELDNWSKVKFDAKYDTLTPEQKLEVEEIAAERIKNTYPTYDRALPALLSFSKFAPFIGNFMAFQAEVYRTVKNNFNYAIQDIRSDNTAQIRLGFDRLMGIMFYTGLKVGINYAVVQASGHAVSALWAAASGDDDEETKRKNLDKFLPDYLTSANLNVEDKGDGVYSVKSIDRLDPYNNTWQIANAFNSGADGGLWKATKEAGSPFVEPDMLAQSVWDLARNEDRRGYKIYNEADTEEDQALAMGAYIWKQVEPSSIKFGKSLLKADDVGEELLTSLLGGRSVDVDIFKGFNAALKDAETKIAGNKSFAFSKAYSKFADPEDIEKELSKDKENLKRILKEMHDIYTASIQLGVSPEKLQRRLKSSFFAQKGKSDMTYAIITGNVSDEVLEDIFKINPRK